MVQEPEEGSLSPKLQEAEDAEDAEHYSPLDHFHTFCLSLGEYLLKSFR